MRKAICIPANFITTHNGIDFVHLNIADGTVIETPVQRGQPRVLDNLPDGIEILSGLKADDELVQP